MKEKKKVVAVVLIAAVAVVIVAACAVFAGMHGSGQTVSNATRNGGEAWIHLAQEGTTASGSGISVDGNRVLVNHGGTYHIDGELEDGQIYVKVAGEETVTLSLDGVSISNKTDHPIHVENAGETVLTSGTDSLNTVTAGTTVAVGSSKDAQVAAIYSRDDLTIEKGNYKVTASGDGVHGNDDITVKGGTITIQCGDDGIHANEELRLKDGSVKVEQSYEGLEANQIFIEGGEHDVTSSDDGVNANGGTNAGGGKNGFGGGKDHFGGERGRDGVGRDPDGRQSASGSSMDGGDRIRQGSGDTGSSMDGGDRIKQGLGGVSMDEEDGTNEEKTPNLTISGGKLTVDAEGDGLDSNGNLTVTGGEVIVDGPSSDGNGALDADFCRVDGGTVIAVGSSGMAETFGGESSQCSFRYNFDMQFSENTEILIRDEAGNEICRHVAKRALSSVVFSSPELEDGKTYVLKAGEQTEEITLSGISTTLGASVRGMGGGMKGRGGRL